MASQVAVSLGGLCFTCLKLSGERNRMEVRPNGYFCSVCKTFRPTSFERGMRPALSKIIFIEGFTLLLFATVIFTAFPQLEVQLTWTLLSSLYLVYFGLAILNLRKNLYV